MSTEKNIALEFNEFSKNYTGDMIACVPRYMDLVNSFVKELPENFQPGNILDLGCGNGNITAKLISEFPDANYLLVDASAEMISICRKQFQKYKVRYANTYFKDFEFKTDTFDLVVAGFSLHHCEDAEKQQMFRKIYTSLKPGGRFLYSDLMISKDHPDHPELLKTWKDFVSKTFPDGEKWDWIMEHYEAFDRPANYQDQVEWLRNSGFADIEIPFKDGYWIFLQAVKL